MVAFVFCFFFLLLISLVCFLSFFSGCEGGKGLFFLIVEGAGFFFKAWAGFCGVYFPSFLSCCYSLDGISAWVGYAGVEWAGARACGWECK